MNIDWQQPYWLILLIPVRSLILFFAKGGKRIAISEKSPYHHAGGTLLCADSCHGKSYIAYDA